MYLVKIDLFIIIIIIMKDITLSYLTRFSLSNVFYEEQSIGKITQIIGPVVDVSFASIEELPNIYDALRFIPHINSSADNTNSESGTSIVKTFEVHQVLGDNLV